MNEKATFAAGCFWCVEEDFRKLKGVVSTSCGYSGGKMPQPTYKQVCSSATGHAEVVEIIFNPQQISYEELLETFWAIHDPTTKDRQGPDVGSQYRSAIFYHSPEQKIKAEESKAKMDGSGRFMNLIVTQILPIEKFYMAEDYHQQYYEKMRGN
jgi:peptide-methionine (S)-S-oxide reductase